MKFIRHILVASIFLYSLQVIFWLFTGIFHCHPNVEDIELAIIARDIGLWKSFIHLAITYDGRYTTNFLHGFNTLVINKPEYYQYMILFALLMFLLSIFIVAEKLFSFKNRFYHTAICLFFAAIFFQMCPSLANCIYWMGSSFVYFYPCIFFILLIIVLLQYGECSTPLKPLYFIATAVILIIGIGFSELFLPLYLLLFAIILPLYIKHTFPHLSHFFLPVNILGIICVLFVVATPGVSYRFESASLSQHINPNIFFSSIINYGITLMRYSLSPTALMLYLLSGWINYSKTASSKYTFSPAITFYIIAGTFFIPYLMTLPYYITKGNEMNYPVRIYIPIVFLHLFLAFFIIIPAVINNQKVKMLLQKKTFYSGYAPILFLCLLSFFSVAFYFGNGSVGKLYKEYQSGKLTRFDNFMSERYQLFSAAGNKDKPYNFICVEALTEYPVSLYTHPDAEDNRKQSKWNKYIESYFHIDEVKTINDTSVRFVK